MTLKLRGLLGAAFVVASSLAAAQSQIIARIVPGANPLAIAARFGITYVDQTENAPFVLFQIPNGGEGDQFENSMRLDPEIVFAEDNDSCESADGQGVKGSGLPSIGGRTTMYALNKDMLKQINFSESLANTSGRPVKIAILDNGISPFMDYVWRRIDATANFVEPGLGPWDVPMNEDTNGNGIVDEKVGHGTMIAGLVDQIDPLGRLIIVRVSDSDGNATAWSVIKGLAFAANHGAEVANISLGSPTQVPALGDVLDWCEDKNLLVIAPIGNGGQKQALFPANYSKAVCVSGVNPDNTKADFSNWDSTCDSSAPAVGIYSLYWTGTLGLWSGTSFASPMVAAAVADCLRRTTAAPGPDFIRKQITPSGDDINRINPVYQGNLGTLLDIPKLNKALLGGGRPGRG